ncbi:MAG: prepilin-type N-terminal cleavage/methylation domain-containing protein [Polyangiaceae bacterium]|nr:prepilin-type N-terminal cleavage/methylation domain-containing protein [Polyangiaceae bacterium]
MLLRIQKSGRFRFDAISSLAAAVRSSKRKEAVPVRSSPTASTSRQLESGRGGRRGFSLLEVMVAVAILGLTLTVILSAQGGLAASNRAAANMGMASTLGRCKMTEIEQKLLTFGLPETDQIDQEVACCNDVKREGFLCDARVEKVELPNFQSGNSLGDGGALIMPGGDGGSELPLGALTANPAGDAGLNLDVDGGLAGVGTQLTQQFGGGMGAEGLMSMVMGFLYPSIKPMFEASIRRVTVTVKWKEGITNRELPLIQYLTNPQRGGFAGSALLPDGGTMDFAPATGTTGTTTGVK